MIADPPLLPGATQVSDSCCTPPVATIEVGTVATVIGVAETELDAADSYTTEPLLIAVTVNE